MKLRDALQAVYDRHGSLTAELVVETARDGTDAVAQRLHESLPWDPDEALEKYQLLVAHKLIRKFKVQYKPTPRSSLRETRAFISIPSPEGRAYHPADVVAANPLMERLALQDAERRWRELKATYGHMREFIDMVRRDLEEGQAEAA